MVAVLGVLVVGTSLIWREQSELVNLRITFSGISLVSLGYLCADTARFLYRYIQSKKEFPSRELLNREVRHRPHCIYLVISILIVFYIILNDVFSVSV